MFQGRPGGPPCCICQEKLFLTHKFKALGGALSAWRRSGGVKKLHVISMVEKVTPIIDEICVHTHGGVGEDFQTVGFPNPELKHDSNIKAMSDQECLGTWNAPVG